MVYFLTVLVLALLIFRYDLSSHRDVKSAETWYFFSLLWFVAVSGFAYNVGSDIPIYMDEYDDAVWNHIHDFSDIMDFKDRRQPGWVLLELICHSITANFVFLKCVVALFCNWAIFRFIKRHSKYRFMALFFYAIILYLHLNFNSLRQGIAVGFFLIGLDFLIEGKWGKYYLLVACGWLFHSSAIICLIIPFFRLLKFSKKTLFLLLGLLVAFTFILIRLDIQGILFGILSSDLISSEVIQELNDTYLSGDPRSSAASIIGVIVIAIQVGLIALVTYLNYGILRKEERNLILICMLFYMLITILNRAVPVLFSRLLQYFDVIYVCLLSNAVVEFSKRYAKSLVLVPLLIIVFSYFPIQQLKSINKSTDLPLYVQYYPYYSIINPKIDPVRDANFGSHK